VVLYSALKVVDFGLEGRHLEVQFVYIDVGAAGVLLNSLGAASRPLSPVLRLQRHLKVSGLLEIKSVVINCLVCAERLLLFDDERKIRGLRISTMGWLVIDIGACLIEKSIWNARLVVKRCDWDVLCIFCREIFLSLTSQKLLLSL
jgi:hypothetical protein